MKFLDRFTGRQVELAGPIESGRYELLFAAKLNDEIDLRPGDVLLSDGRERCKVGNISTSFVSSSDAHPENSPNELIRRSVTTIVDGIRNRPDEGFSPLIPSKLGDIAKMSELDRLLQVVVARGHLNEISERPRISLRYDEEVAHLSRVKKMAPGAEIRLAAHSEDWYRRTVSSVLPKKLLGLFSDDDWSIYENRVFARLLDRFDIYLKTRLNNIEQLHRKYDEALRLADSEVLYFRLRESLCALWGRALSPSETQAVLKTSADSIEVLKGLSKRIGNLRQSGLYKRVSRSEQVPVRLRATNILAHDQHYRHLRRLWHLLHAQSSECPLSAAEVFEQNRRFLGDYTSYLGAMLNAILASMRLVSRRNATDGQFKFAGREGTIEIAATKLKIEFAGRTLVLVPALCAGEAITTQVGSVARHVPVFCFPALAAPSGIPPDERTGDLIVNPLEFLGMERLRQLVVEFLWYPAFADYGKPIEKIPTAVQSWLINHKIGRLIEGGWALVEPLTGSRRQEFDNSLPAALVNASMRSELQQTAESLDALNTCGQCGAKAEFSNRGHDFEARCHDCSLAWGIYSDGTVRSAKFGVLGNSNQAFATHGAWHIRIQVKTTEARA